MTAEAPDVVDAHHHLWDPQERAYPFLARPGLEPLRRRFDVDDLAAAVAGAGVRGTVVVQAVGSEDETRALLAAAASSGGLVAGVVGWADLLAEDVNDRLEALRAAAGGDRLVGIRHQVEDEPAGWLTAPAAVRGIVAVARAGLVYDLLVRPDQLGEAAALADAVTRAVPTARLVLDHGAKPPVGAPAWGAWADGVAALARREQVTVKLSGLLVLVPPSGGPGDLQPSVDHLLDAFGPDRLMVGSDWPVSTLAAGYADVVARARTWVARLGPDERLAAVSATAERTYALASLRATTTHHDR